MNILLSSGGRRPYLTRWFKNALTRNLTEGVVVVADSDPFAPAQAEADAFFVAPRASDAEYALWLGDLLVEQAIDLAISINDFELSVWSELREQDSAYFPLIALSPAVQAMVEDKVMMGAALAKEHIPAPSTVIATQLDRAEIDGEMVVKGRFGSGSRGLAFTDAAGLQAALDRAAGEVTDAAGRPPQDRQAANRLIVVQPRVRGQEFGLDVVNDLSGEFVTVLARRKLAMREGETDKATTVDGTRFAELAKSVSSVTRHRGLIDVDVLVEESGRISVIDVNPRFGGGYPFSHVAGADVPAAYVAWALDRQPHEEWLVPRPGITGAKFVDVAVAGALK